MLQRSPEWYVARLGKVTASRFADVMTKAKKAGEVSKVREAYLTQLVAEMMTGVSCETFTGNRATAHGEDQEFDSTIAIEAVLGVAVEPCGFFDHPEIEACGASPDGFATVEPWVGPVSKRPTVMHKGTRIYLPAGRFGVEMKCPYNPVHHAKALRFGMPDEHRPQVQGGMWVTGLDGWLFTSYDQRFPKPHDLYVELVLRDPDYCAELAREVRLFAEQRAMVFKQLMGG
jgi:hypothetical protein